MSKELINKTDLIILLMDLNLDHVQTEDGKELIQIIEEFPAETVN